MTRIGTTDNKQYADEIAAHLRNRIKAGKSSDTVEVREFRDGRGQPIYEVWLHHSTVSGQKS